MRSVVGWFDSEWSAEEEMEQVLLGVSAEELDNYK